MPPQQLDLWEQQQPDENQQISRMYVLLDELDGFTLWQLRWLRFETAEWLPPLHANAFAVIFASDCLFRLPQRTQSIYSSTTAAPCPSFLPPGMMGAGSSKPDAQPQPITVEFDVSESPH
jgi:hypothetical protein